MTDRIPPLPALRAFAAVARAGSFARAAETLNISTSAVSHQIRALEDSLGTTLLTRARNGAGQTGVTEAGAPLLTAIESAFADLSNACETVRARGGKKKPALSISANGSVCSLWLAPRLAAFAALHPSVGWEARAIEEEPDLIAANLDLAILRAPRGRMASGDRLLFSETIFPVCGPALLDGADPPRLLREKSLLEEDHGASTERGWRTWLDLLGIPGRARPNIVRFSSFNAVVAAAIAGAGVALGRAPLIDSELRAGRLVRLFPEKSLPGSWDFVIRTRPGAARDGHVRQFMDYLIQAGSS
jgi:LysR family glycine cleavage system transcriptional activator